MAFHIIEFHVVSLYGMSSANLLFQPMTTANWRSDVHESRIGIVTIPYLPQQVG